MKGGNRSGPLAGSKRLWLRLNPLDCVNHLFVQQESRLRLKKHEGRKRLTLWCKVVAKDDRALTELAVHTDTDGLSAGVITTNEDMRCMTVSSLSDTDKKTYALAHRTRCMVLVSDGFIARGINAVRVWTVEPDPFADHLTVANKTFLGNTTFADTVVQDPAPAVSCDSTSAVPVVQVLTVFFGSVIDSVYYLSYELFVT